MADLLSYKLNLQGHHTWRSPTSSAGDLKNNQGNQTMAQRGGKRPGAGRKPGKVGKAKRALSEMAKDHVEAALQTLAEIQADPETPAAARVSAATAILDRAYGKPPVSMALSNPDGSPLAPTRVEIVAAGHDNGKD